MACAGIDFGSSRSVVAIARRGGIDICCNEVSNRATPSLVSFQGDERAIGEAAASIAAANSKNTVSGLQRLLGVDGKSVWVEKESKWVTCPIVVDTGSGCAAVDVAYDGEEGGRAKFTYQQIVAMFLGELMDIASVEYKGPVRDCVVSVPCYYTEAQRRALLDAAKIANVNVLRVVNEHAAIALSYGIFRTKELPEVEPIKVAFVDVGQSSTTVSIAAFTSSRCDILSVASDSDCGGRDLDALIVEKFVAEFKEKYGIDALSKPRPKARIYKECEKLKKVLSANAQAPLNIECLMNDIDVKSQMKRSELEELAVPFVERIRAVCEKAIADAGLVDGEKLFAVEIIGACTRVPAVKAVVEEVFSPLGAPMRSTLNMDECIARGCALMSAMLSPAFKVREYTVKDVAALTLDAEKVFTDGSAPESMTLVAKYHPLPCLKAMTFKAPGPLTINVKYSDPTALPLGEEVANICSYLIDAPVDPEAKVRVKVRVTANSTVEVASATLSKEVEVEEEVSVKKAKTPAAAPAGSPAPADAATEMANGDAMKVEVPATANAKDGAKTDAQTAANTSGESNGKEGAVDEPEPITETRIVKKMKTTDLKVTMQSGVGCGLLPEVVLEATEKEAKMRANDLYIKERSEARNSLEGYVYDLRSRIEYGDLKDFGPQEVRSALKVELDAAEEWIYSDEGESPSKSAFVARKAAFVAKAAPMLFRKKESEERDVRVNLLQATLDSYKQLAVPGLEEYAHIAEEEKAKVIKCVEDAALWLKGELAKQEPLAKDVDPILTCAALNAKRSEVDALCRPIQTTPKPKVEEKKPEETAAPDATAAAPMDTSNGTSTPSAEAKADGNVDAAPPAVNAKTDGEDMQVDVEPPAVEEKA